MPAVEMRLFRAVKRYTRREHIENVDIRKEPQIYSLYEKIKDNRTRWVNHMNRMDPDRLTAQTKQ